MPGPVGGLGRAQRRGGRTTQAAICGEIPQPRHDGGAEIFSSRDGRVSGVQIEVVAANSEPLAMTVALQSGLQGLAIDAEDTGGFALIAAHGVDDAEDVPPLDVGQWHELAGGLGRG